MALKNITYSINNPIGRSGDLKKKRIKVKICNTIFSKATGLMFRKNSPPLLFVFNKNKILKIHSLFCKPFTAIWLDEKMNSTKIVVVKRWKLDISGKGKFLLEIPLVS